MKLKRMAAMAALSIALPGISATEAGKITTKWSYQGTDGKRSASSKTVEISHEAQTRAQFSTDERMSKTLLLLNVATELKGSLDAYANVCKGDNKVRPMPPTRPICVYPGRPGCFPPPRPEPSEDRCQADRKEIAKRLLATVAKFDRQIGENPFARKDRGAVEALDYARKLSTNMEKTPEPQVYRHLESMSFRSMGGARAMSAPMMAAAPGGLNVTSGGAQGYDQFKKIVDAGHVPSSEVLTIDGFLKEFDLSLTEERCDELLCVTPAVSLDRAAKKMFVQISMGSNVRPDTFRRKPLNLSVVLDVSGSMGATDGTEKSRLEWAKDALNRIVDKLSGDDYLSIVLFDQSSRVARESAPVTNRAELKALINSIRTGGSTNLEAGMRDGLRLVHSKLGDLPDYEHRVITISDAGTNTGIQDEASFVRLVNNYANDGIGVTVLGVGDDFRGGLVQGFAMTKGGNFQHAQSGLAMLKFFENFEFLVTPVAYNFKANLALDGLKAKFAKAYGVPVKEGQAIDELINIQTLFFSTGGGAIVLEYHLD